MIRYYKANMPGPYHLDNDIPCQDSYFILKSANGVVCAACADGLGSEIFSDVGSRIASQVAVEHCIANFGYFWMWIAGDGFAHVAERVMELPLGFSINLLIMIFGNAIGSLCFSKI